MLIKGIYTTSTTFSHVVVDVGRSRGAGRCEHRYRALARETYVRVSSGDFVKCFGKANSLCDRGTIAYLARYKRNLVGLTSYGARVVISVVGGSVCVIVK